MARAKTKTEEATEKEAPVPEAETKTEEATEKEAPVPEAETKTEEATEKEAPVPEADTIDDAKALHALLAAYFTSLASLKSPPPTPPLSGLNALVYWQEYFANPDHLLPQDISFVRGRIWS